MEINKVFRNNEFGELSVIVKDKKEYFEAIPVATILGYQNPRGAILRHCKEEGEMCIRDSDIDTLRQMISQSIPQLVNSAATIVSVLISMIILNIPLTILTLIDVYKRQMYIFIEIKVLI